MSLKILYISLSICLGFFLINTLWKSPNDISIEDRAMIMKELSILTSREKADIEELFRHFFFFDEFAYPLFGSKPMSIGRLESTASSLNGWKAWKKIAPRFISEKFVLDEYTFKGHSFVLIANLDLIEKTYKENQPLFEMVFKEEISLERLKNGLKNRNDFFLELLENHLIMGILLGYGSQNAQNFSLNQKLPEEKQKRMKPFTPYHPIFYYFSKVTPPYFACDPDSEETHELKKRYRQERKVIIEMGRRAPLFFRMLLALKDHP